MANTDEKMAAKAAKEAAKAAEKAKKERIKNNKPKKDKDAPNVFVRIWEAIKNFFKNFAGTCKKVVWPDRKTVLKSTAVVCVCVLIVGIMIWVVDYLLGGVVGLVEKGVSNLGSNVVEEGTTAATEELSEIVESVVAGADDKE